MSIKSELRKTPALLSAVLRRPSRLGLKKRQDETERQFNKAQQSARLGFSPPPKPIDDRELVRRIVASYQLAQAEFSGHGASLWAGVNESLADVHAALVAGNTEAVSNILRNPHLSRLRNGFDNPVAGKVSANLCSIEVGQAARMRIYMSLKRLSEAIGATRLSNPEVRLPTALSVEDYILALDKKLGFRIDFPNPHPHEQGLISTRGIIAFRALQAIYQAWRLATMKASRVLEIGAGLGRTAYYAVKLGITDYTIVDIPMTNVSQADFLGRALGANAISLTGEQSRAPVRIFGPDFISRATERFDIALNVDSITEFDPHVARSYCEFISAYCDRFVSINPEYFELRVSDHFKSIDNVSSYQRFPYWMREGYAEEVFEFSRPSNHGNADSRELLSVGSPPMHNYQRP